MTGNPTEPLPTVAVIIPTVGRPVRLSRALDAVLRQNPLEVIVVVNGKDPEGAFATLQRRAEGDARLRPFFVDAPDQFAALQFGADQSRSDVLLCLDDDVMAGPSLVAGHARHHAAGRSLLVLGYMPVRLPDRRRKGHAPMFVYSGVYEAHCADYDRDPARVLTNLWAGNFSIRRDDALTIGFRNPTRMPFHGDQEFGLRCREAGLGAVFDRRLLAQHEYARTQEQFLREARDRARSAYLIAGLHADGVGPDFLDRYGKAFPFPARWVVRSGRYRAGAAVALPLTRVVLWVAGTVRWWRLESLAADVALNLLEVRATVELRAGAV